MHAAGSTEELKVALGGAVTFDGAVKVADWAATRERGVDILAWTVAFSKDSAAKRTAAWVIRELARQAGNGPASIHEVYIARGKGQLAPDFTVPAMNVRAMAYYFSRAIYRTAKKHQAGAILCELSRSEMGYTGQNPEEYVSSILAGALREGYPYPVFIQGDHFQINAKSFAKDAHAEILGLKKLSHEAMAAGFYNIDIDTSTLVDLSKPDLPGQQELNCTQCALLTEYIRAHQPAGHTISLGGEIGEVGGKNSTVEELEAFVSGYNKLLKKGTVGLSKISVQTGTSHGGVVLPDGTMAQVKVDFDTLAKLSEASRKTFGMGGAVQHGASTLPIDLFDKFPQTGTTEIHLATEFQNIVYEHPEFPAALKTEMYAWLKKECANEAKAGESDAQFYYKTRKKAIGPFKDRLWGLPDAVRDALVNALADKVDVLYRKLNIVGTGPKIKPFVKLPDTPVPHPGSAAAAAAEHFEGDD